MVEKVEYIRVNVIVEGEEEAFFILKPNESEGTEVTVGMSKELRPMAIIGVMALALHSALTHIRGREPLAEHWQDFEPMLLDTLTINEMMLGLEVDLERARNDGLFQ